MCTYYIFYFFFKYQSLNLLKAKLKGNLMKSVNLLLLQLNTWQKLFFKFFAPFSILFFL